MSEKNNQKIEVNLNDIKKELTNERDKCKKLNDDIQLITERENKLLKNFSTLEQAKLMFENDLKRTKSDLESTKTTMSIKLTKITAELIEVKKERDKFKTQYEEEKIKNDFEINNLLKKMAALEKLDVNMKMADEVKQTFNEKISSAYTKKKLLTQK